MPTAKARYTGSKPTIRPSSDKLRSELRSYYPDKGRNIDPLWGDPADEFVELILSAANSATSEFAYQQMALTKEELRAEQRDLLKVL
jgi:hypothetical protein